MKTFSLKIQFPIQLLLTAIAFLILSVSCKKETIDLQQNTVLTNISDFRFTALRSVPIPIQFINTPSTINDNFWFECGIVGKTAFFANKIDLAKPITMFCAENVVGQTFWVKISNLTQNETAICTLSNASEALKTIDFQLLSFTPTTISNLQAYWHFPQGANRATHLVSLNSDIVASAFNDLVINYSQKASLNRQGLVTRLQMSVAVQASGSTVPMALGLCIPNKDITISSATGGRFTERVFTYEYNGTVNWQGKTLVPIFDHTFSVINRRTGQGVNTNTRTNFASSDTLQIVINFSNPITVNQLLSFNQNLVAFESQDLNKPICTFGSVNNNNHNLRALTIPAEFMHIREGETMVHAYPLFAGWLNSNGNQNQDWFLPKNANTASLFR